MRGWTKGGSLINIGSKVERMHPMARFIRENHSKILGWNSVLVTVFFFGFAFFCDRGFAFGWMAAMVFPAFIMYFLIRCFSVYRVTDCPYCGYHHEQRLGRSFWISSQLD